MDERKKAIKGILIKDEDSRVKLQEVLCFIGVPKLSATLIALDAGSSQCKVGKYYLEGMNIGKADSNEVMKYVRKFYRDGLESKK